MKKLFSSIALALTLTLAFAAPAFAEETTTKIEPTFSEEVSEQGEFAKIRFGKNQLFAGNTLDVNTKSNGLLFAFGNQLQLGSQSEYAFIAGNMISYSATTEKDLFIAGNIIDLKSGAKIGRDVYAAGYRVILASNLSGDFSAAGNQIILRDVEIAGNVNLDAASISLEGEISIAGTLSYNDDAQIYGLDNVEAAKVETYTPVSHGLTAAELWLSKVVSIISLSLVAIVILALSVRIRTQTSGEKSTQSFGANLVAGFVALLLMPVVAIILLMSYFAAPLGVMVIVAYIIMFYLAQALAGAWLGHVIVSKLLHSQAHVFIEAIIGIIIVVILSMIPGLGIITSFLATLLGFGIIVRSVKPSKNSPEETTIPASKSRKLAQSAAPAKSAKTAKTAKAAKTAKSAKSAKSTSSTKSAKKGQK